MKDIISLKQQKYRHAAGVFVVEGVKMVEEALASRYNVLTLCGTPPFWEAHPLLAAHAHIETFTVSESELQRMSSMTTPQQVLAVVQQVQAPMPQNIGEQELVLALESVRNPGNLGTIIRIAEWFGVPHILCSPDTVELYNPKVIQASMGSFFRVPLHYTPLTECLSAWKKQSDVRIFGLALSGENIYKTTLPSAGILVLGNESHGISDHCMAQIDTPLHIPAVGNSQAESLNVAMAAAVACSEFKRALMAV